MLIALVVAQLGIISFLVKHSRFFKHGPSNQVALTPALELDLVETVPRILPEPSIDYGPAVLPAADSILVVYHPPQPQVPPLDVQWTSHEKEIVLDLSAPPLEFTKTQVKKTKPKTARKALAREKKAQPIAKQALKKNDKTVKHEKPMKTARPQPKLERVKIVSLPAKRSPAKASRTVASIMPTAPETSLERAASMAADESHHENSVRRDARRKKIARESERVKGVFEEE